MNDVTTPPSDKANAGKDANKEKKEKAPRVSKFAAIYPDDARITVLVDKNPKKEGSKAHERFKLYANAKTVKDFIAAGGTYSDIAYNVGRQFIKVG